MESDTELQEAVRRYIDERPDVRDGELTVQVSNGVVTLTGTMRSDREKWQIEDAIRAMPGVASLLNGAMIVPQGATGESDSDIARPFFPAS